MSKNCIFKGCGTALVTPMKADGSLNLPEYRKLIDTQIEDGIDALIICGTTGEASTLTLREYEEAVSFAVEAIGGRVPAIAGTGTNFTDSAIERTRIAAKAGADCALTVTPYYNKTTQKGLVRHFTAIAECSDLPLILYNVPSRTALEIEPETYAVLSRHEKILGVKEAGTNLSKIQRSISLCPEDFTFYSGNDDMTIPLMACGAKGLISVTANLLPRLFRELTASCLENRWEHARELFRYLQPLVSLMFAEVNPIPVKYTLPLLGIQAGPVRMPLAEPADATMEKIEACLERMGL